MEGNNFHGAVSYINEFNISVELTSVHSGAKWILTNIYGSCEHDRKPTFVDWLQNIDMAADWDWLLVGDFNLIRNPDNKNKPGGDINEMLMFNEAISSLNIVEIPLKGNKYTWSDKQENPLLVRLDWFFTSRSWLSLYPGTKTYTLSTDTSDHIPCVISIENAFPKAKTFQIFFKLFLMHGAYQSNSRIRQRN